MPTCEQWKKGPYSCLGCIGGWNPTQLYGDNYFINFINHYRDTTRIQRNEKISAVLFLWQKKNGVLDVFFYDLAFPQRPRKVLILETPLEVEVVPKAATKKAPHEGRRSTSVTESLDWPPRKSTCKGLTKWIAWSEKQMKTWETIHDLESIPLTNLLYI